MPYDIKSRLPHWSVTNKKILLRADLNVPLHDTNIVDDFRLRKAQPTLDYILSNGGSVVLATHLGRPRYHDPTLSTQLLLPWFAQQHYNVIFAHDLNEAHSKIIGIQPGTILLLENTRFFEGEQTHDQIFAQNMASLADLYVDDAFGALHRTDSSITLVPRFFSEDHRAIGFLVEHELAMLNKILVNPEHPFALMVGGAKIKQKIAVLKHLVESIDMLFLCPPLVFSFMKAMGKPVGRSLVDDSLITTCRSVLDSVQKLGKKLVMPVDYQVARGNVNGPLHVVPADEIPPDCVGMSIGPETSVLFAQQLMPAKTIFYAGLMGMQERPATLEGFKSLLEEFATNEALTVIGGGDTVSAAQRFSLAKHISFCSTGGGSTLAYLSGKPLPGIESLYLPGLTFNSKNNN